VSTQNEDSKTQQSLPGTLVEHPVFDLGKPPPEDALAVGPVEEPVKSEGATQGIIEKPPKKLDGTQKAPRGKARKGQSGAQMKGLDPIAPVAKPAGAKRAKTRPAGEAKDQAEAVSKAKRTAIKKARKVADSPVPAAPMANDIPHALENSIELSPVQLVEVAPQHSDVPPAAATQRSTTAGKSHAQTTTFAAQDGNVARDTAPYSSLGRRLRFTLGNIGSWAVSWLFVRSKEGQAPPAAARVSLDKSAATPAPAKDKSDVVPESVARRFLKVEREYYFQDRTHAFSDRGTKLATRGTELEVVRSLVEIAKARGWDTINVKGTEEFRRSAWMEATQQGLTVVGYKPTPLDLADLANQPANNTVEKGRVDEKSRESKQSSAQRQTAPVSPARPAAATQTAEQATAPEALRADAELAVKVKAFKENKPAFVVKKYPDLAAAYGIVAAAKAFAVDKLPESARDDFVNMARRHMIEKIEAGEKIQGPKIYLAPTKTSRAPDQTAEKEGVDLGKVG